MKKNLIIFLVCLVMPLSVYAGAMNTAAKTCADWGEHRNISDSLAEVDEAWIVGYLSGISASADVDFIKMINTDSIKDWMDKYCKIHTLKFLTDGGQALALELIDRKH